MELFELPELDRKATQKAVESTLAKYRLFKYLTFDEREASTTASYELQEGKGSGISDQTAQVAISNADEQKKRKEFCEWIERAVKRLPPMERFLIERRYMREDAEYMTDYKVYCFEFQPPISERTYAKIRWKAFYKLALNLNVAVTKQGE